MSINDFAYRGSTFLHNIGDQAIYYANSKLFKDKNLVPAQYAEDASVAFFGGGTLLPRALRPEKDLYDLNDKNLKYCMGIGVNDPQFYNSPKAEFDIRYWAGQKGLNLKNIMSWRRPIHYAVNKTSDFLGDEWLFNMEYYDEKHFELIKKFGFDRITVRGPLSKEILSNYGISSKIVGDPALYLEPDEYDLNFNNKAIVSLRHLGKDKWGDINMVKEVIEFCNEIKLDVVFLPFHHKDIPINYYACKQVDGAKIKMTHHLQIDDVLNYINSAGVLIGERLHTSVLAACCYTPFISLAYRPKNFDFAESINQTQYCIHNDKVTKPCMMETFHETRSNYNDRINTIEKNVLGMREQLIRIQKKINEDISDQLF